MGYLTDGVHLYEKLGWCQNYGLTGGGWLTVRDCLTGLVLRDTRRGTHDDVVVDMGGDVRVERLHGDCVVAERFLRPVHGDDLELLVPRP